MGRLERVESAQSAQSAEPADSVGRDAGRCVLIGSTRNPAMYAQEWLTTIPFPFQVEAGDELRAAVAEVAARFTAASAGTPNR
jgi:hypothetical protein